MCGIAGIVQLDGGGVDSVVFEDMVDTLAHRGPDGRGVENLGPVALGHRRLAIVDIESGRQPMESVDGRLLVVANAEIYNSDSLRRQLKGKGHIFSTRSDVEVIIHGYEEWGRDVTAHLTGMFAFAVVDKRERILFLARDRFGEKPLYYSRSSGRFIFASEPKAIFAGQNKLPEIEPDALARYLLLDFIPAPWSIYRDIFRLPPAHWLELHLESGMEEMGRYWDVPFERNEIEPIGEVCEKLERLFHCAVERTMQSDVPVGLLLSGGLDSSLVGASMRRVIGPGKAFPSFSIGFREEDFDESANAARVSCFLGSSHQSETYTVEKFHERIAQVVASMDEPLADASWLAMDLLSGLVQNEVKVVLGGDGADELFGGYDVFLANKLDGWTGMAGSLRPLCLRALSRVLPAGEGHFSLGLRLRQAAIGLEQDREARPIGFLMNHRLGEMAGLMPSLSESTDLLKEFRDTASSRCSNALEQGLRLFTKVFLESDILTKTDRTSMAHGVEIRSPFLDHELAEYAAHLPSRLKVNGVSRKWILKKALGHTIPEWVVRRKKQGFAVPIARWINQDMSDWFNDVLLDPSNYADHLIDRPEVERLLTLHRKGALNLRKPIWNLAVLMMWKQGRFSQNSGNGP